VHLTHSIQKIGFKSRDSTSISTHGELANGTVLSTAQHLSLPFVRVSISGVCDFKDIKHGRCIQNDEKAMGSAWIIVLLSDRNHAPLNSRDDRASQRGMVEYACR
jgi:hypothetical protein